MSEKRLQDRAVEQAFFLGKQAFSNGLPKTANPYDPIAPFQILFWAKWNLGWTRQKIISEKKG